MKKIQNLDLENKKVFLRCDFNVPVDINGNITDFKRVNSVLETIKYLLDKKCSIIISSHLGRPKGFDKNFSLKPVQRVLRALLRWPVKMAKGVVDDNTIKKVKSLKQGEILLLENLRFDKREKENSKEFAKILAFMGEIYINDAFGVCHRKHASIDQITEYFADDEKAAGFLVQKEKKYFSETIKKPKRPFIAIVGGSKVSSKLLTIKKLIENVDKIIIGGAMAFTFLKAMGYEIGKSLIENDLLDEAKNILKTAKKLNKKIILPIDFIISEEFSEQKKIRSVDFDKIPKNMMGLDIGEKSIRLFQKECDGAKTIFWNGPMGAYEFNSYFEGSASIANLLATHNALTFAGGGDSIGVINKLGLAYELDFVSTGGGASLKLLEGEKLIGIQKLK